MKNCLILESHSKIEKIVPPIKLLPENVENIKSIEIRKGTLYIITCNKK